MGALNDLKDQGKIRSIGVSNFSRPQLQEAVEYGQIDSLQAPAMLVRQAKTPRQVKYLYQMMSCHKYLNSNIRNVSIYTIFRLQ